MIKLLVQNNLRKMLQAYFSVNNLTLSFLSLSLLLVYFMSQMNNSLKFYFLCFNFQCSIHMTCSSNLDIYIYITFFQFVYSKTLHVKKNFGPHRAVQTNPQRVFASKLIVLSLPPKGYAVYCE